jgi:UDP-N-acetylglucosamine 2-epimerase (non-hydrolysing)
VQVEKEKIIVTIAGTRPEIIKLAELVKLLNDSRDDHALLYTGQHYSDKMRGVFFEELGIKPDYDLMCESSDVPTLAHKMRQFLETVKPSIVLIYGDTNSSLAGAQAAKQVGCRIVHIEAGLRCFDMLVPEEKARMEIDSISDFLFPPTELAETFLRYERIEDNVFTTGNLIVDVCKRLSRVADTPSDNQNVPSDYLLLTMHRQENVDNPERLQMLCKHLAGIKHKIVFPIHPRTKNNLSKFGISLPQNVITVEPAGYIEFLRLLKNCRAVLTDSGGVQEEAVVLGRPCITLRHVSERWETLLLKANVLFPLFRQDSMSDVVEEMIDKKITSHPYGNDVARNMMSRIDQIAA